MERTPGKLQAKLAERLQKNAIRSLQSVGNLVDFSSNDYLGLARNGELVRAAHKFLEGMELKNGASGSRLLSGNHALYPKLEEFLAAHHHADTALVFNSGYDANIGFFSSVPQRGDIVIFDELVHASIRDGMQMGHAKSYKFAHNDIEDLSRHIERSRNMDGSTEIYIVTESVFSMDGDSPDLRGMAKLCKENNCFLVVDEAHATGVFGKGTDLISELGLETEVFARIITFGKAMGCHGAAILGSRPLTDYLINFARSFIYTTALPPHAVASILAAYDFLKGNGAHIAEQLHGNIAHFKHEMERLQLSDRFIQSHSAIQCMLVPGNAKVRSVAKELQEEGFDVKPILSPTVKEGQERLRFCLHAYNTGGEISRILSLLKNEIA